MRIKFGVLLGSLLMLILSGCNSSGSPVPTTTLPYFKYTVYPETENPPVLTFYWGVSKEGISSEEVLSIGQYGGWEGSGRGVFKPGWEPATEIELRLAESGKPIYSYTKGTIVYLGDSDLSIRYGKNYVVKHGYVDRMTAFSLGQTIEAGTLLGYTKNDFWEIELDRKIGPTTFRAIPPIDFFDSSSKLIFERLLIEHGKSSWVINGTTAEGWVPYVGTPEMWADPTKMGYNVTSWQTLEEFLDNYGLSWILE